MLFSFVAGCFGPPQANIPPVPQQPAQPAVVNRPANYYNTRRERDDDRRSVLSHSRDRYKGKACEDEDRDHDCKEQCRDIYNRRADREDCEELSISQIERLEELHDLLEDPKKNDLEDDVDHDDFDVYININIQPLDKYIGRYSTREAREFLVWMIENPDIAEIFEKEDDDYDAFEALLKSLKSFSGDDHHLPFIAKADRSDKLMEVAVESGNDDLMEWFLDYINEKNNACEDDETSAGCLTVYCRIGKEMDDDSLEEWLDYEVFEDYINNIIEDKINACNWQRGNNRPATDSEGETCSGRGSAPDPYEESDDLRLNWFEAFCSALI